MVSALVLKGRDHHWSLASLKEDVLLLLHGDGGVIVQSLGLQHLGEFSLAALRLFKFCSLVLKPDLYLVLLQSQLKRKLSPPLLS